jgi:Fanconi anemia group M protein
MVKLRWVVRDLLREKPDMKIIIFANYRSTVARINRLLRADGIKSEILIGQAMREGVGLSQEEQIKTLRRFAHGEFNVLVGSSISEEGLDVVATHTAIFYDQVSSAIRKIQRRGRVGRQIPGRVIFLITRGTRDQAYYWTAFRREKLMKGVLYEMRQKGMRRKKTLLDWTRGGE